VHVRLNSCRDVRRRRVGRRLDVNQPAQAVWGSGVRVPSAPTRKVRVKAWLSKLTARPRPGALAVRGAVVRKETAGRWLGRYRLSPQGPGFDPDEFVDSVRRVAGGGTALDPEVVARLFAGTSGKANASLARLTAREREVLGVMAEGRSNAAIAERLVITERAVIKHTSNIFTKLDLP
jgi:DNA-binding CsgD family transcriptional regulator